jgi:transcriptional regulator with XRE-family HTH domain
MLGCTEIMIDRPGLADFLRRRRELLRPVDLGLFEGVRRRTPGLRPDEVAQLASISTDYYARLEQSRGANPSETIVASLARALRCDPDERDQPVPPGRVLPSGTPLRWVRAAWADEPAGPAPRRPGLCHH